jgi:hypothetical protein
LIDKHQQLKNEQLGMNHATATHILRANIMFDLIQRLKLDVCFRCGELIHSPRDLSFDHKHDWLNSTDPKGLFFDLQNVAFSHKRCNKPRHKMLSKVIGQSGYKGVSYDKAHPSKPWTAHLFYQGKGYKFGSFRNPKDAAQAFDIGVKTIWGDKAITNTDLGLL